MKIDVRSHTAAQLTLPRTPNNLDEMSRDQLLRVYDRFGDYWAVWLNRAAMLHETQDSFTDRQLRAVIRIASSPWARQHWKYWDYDRYPDEHTEFYEEFFRRWDEALGKPKDRNKKEGIIRKKSRSARRKSVKNRHTKSQVARRSRRPGPAVSAAEHSVDDTAKGNDGNQYKVKADKRGVKRWVKA